MPALLIHRSYPMHACYSHWFYALNYSPNLLVFPFCFHWTLFIIIERSENTNLLHFFTSACQNLSVSKQKLQLLLTTDDNEDILSFVRVYSGELSTASKIYNVNRLTREVYMPISWSKGLSLLAEILALM